MSKHFGFPVRRLFKRDKDNNPVFLNDAIKERADELSNAAKDTKLVLFGVVTEAHVQVLKRFLELEQTLPVVVLLFKEPYSLPPEIYQRHNASVVLSPAFPDESAVVGALFGTTT